MKASEADAVRLALIEKLEAEGEWELAGQLEECGEPLELRCLNCGGLHLVHKRCRRKWCPSCQRIVSARRGGRIRNAVKAMAWPLFVTLTVPNSRDVESIRALRRSFGKLRARKTWKEKVTGGVAAIEVTNRGRGWHPHLHAVIDCRWLSVTVPAPAPTDSKERIAEKCLWAKRELQEVWGGCTGAGSPVVHTKRARGATITEEVTKYAMKGSELVACREPVGDLIRALQLTRLVTTFGNLYGRAREFDDDPGEGVECKDCGKRGSYYPDQFINKTPTAA